VRGDMSSGGLFLKSALYRRIGSGQLRGEQLQ
jgi:hypothetical protein